MDIADNKTNKKLKDFGDWIDAGFGKGLAKWFLNPYNYKFSQSHIVIFLIFYRQA